VIVYGLCILFFRDKPTCPPNYSTQRLAIPYTASLKRLISNKNYWLTFLAMSFVFGTGSSFFVVL
jgi:hypothetical protein